MTHIIHNGMYRKFVFGLRLWLTRSKSAYPVDFNKSLGSFESAILSFRRLVDFALSSPLQNPPRVVFISSISVINGEYVKTLLHMRR